VLLVVAALAACGGGETNSSTTSSSSSSSGTGSSTSTTSSSSSSGTGGCGSSGAGGQGGAINPDDACGSLTAPGAAPERVVWVTKSDQPIDITMPVELLWAFQYAVRVPPDKAAEYTLEHERCEEPAGGTETCNSFPMTLPTTDCEVAYAPKFGIDPNQYMPGTNRYTYTMRLSHGCQLVSEDSFTTIVNYTPAP
jgi:hypothetical protein